MYEQIAANRRASWLLMGVMVALLAALGYTIGVALLGSTRSGLGFLGIFGIVAVAWNIIGYYGGSKMVLASSRAKGVTHDEEPRLFNVVEEMSIAAGLPQPPAVYVIEDPAPNAFATGRDPQHASIAVTRGLLEHLDREQLQGVIAHELSHVRNYDIRFATLVGVLVGIIAMVADFFLHYFAFFGSGRRSSNDNNSGQLGAIMFVVAIVLSLLAPLAASLVQLAISRRREYLADASAVELTRNPLGLARALETIAADTHVLAHGNRATNHLYIASALKEKKKRKKSALFDTHPPIEERIAVLHKMAHVEVGATPAQGGELN